MRNFSKIFLIAGTILFLSACGSTPDTEIHYFVLNPNQSTVSNTDLSSQSITLLPIQLAKFLDQPGIVLQTDQHEINVAHYHRWAEPLKNNLHRYISQSIGSNATNETSQTLEIHIQEFQGAADGTALLSGYWLSENKKQIFQYQAPLNTTGYTELVRQLALLLDQLSADIITKIK